jgi:tetratricopeptide (TPR) repeat protein
VDVLNQANAAFAQEDFAQASGLYERAINTPPNGETRETTLTIDDFARFRDAVSLLALGNEDQAKAQIDALQQADADAPLSRVAAQLWDQYGMTGSLRAACAQTQPAAATQLSATMSALNSLGVSVSAQNLCG